MSKTLVDVFHLSEFRPLQRSAINALMAKEDVLLVMSTGGRQSIKQ